MAKKTGQLIIKQHQPVKFWFMVVAYAISLCVAGWGLYYLGSRSAGYDFSELSDRFTAAVEYTQKLEEEKAKLSEQVAVLERDRQVEQHAVSDVDSSLKDMQQEIIELKEEVAFYRGIVAPRESAGGLNVQSFKVEKTGEERAYRFKLVLTQVARTDVMVKGFVRLEIEGVRDGKPAKLSLSEVTGGAHSNLEMKFKFFQTLEGNMVFPVGFAPTGIQVDIVPAGGRAGLNKSFGWDTLSG